MGASLTPEQATEVEFISGVTPAGTVSGTSFWTWNDDDPATYSATQSYAAKWGQPVAGTPGTVTYSFDVASNWTAPEKAAFVATMHLWSAEAGITFSPVVSGAANFTITRGDDGSAEGGITRLYLGTEGTTHLGQATKGEITIDTSVAGFGPIGSSFSNYGGYPWTVLLHEEGHVLGLGHAGAYNEGTTTSSNQLTSYDNRAWSLMSYVDSDDPAVEAAASTPLGGFHWGLSTGDNGLRYYDSSTTPMPLDILAAQRLYGAPASTPLSGGQVFGFNCNVAGDIEPFFDFTINTRPVVTLWDAGGGNTLDLSGYSSGSTVDLHDGAFSSCAGLVNNLAIAFGTRIDALVTGSGADRIQANADGDLILGGAGDDTITGGGNPAGTMEMLFGNMGRDVLSSSSPGSVELFGGQDDDTINLTSLGQGVTHYAFGNLGNDTLTASDGINSLYGGQGNDVVTAVGGGGCNYLSGDLGDDTLTSSNGGGDVLHGGMGRDLIILQDHHGTTDVVLILAGESQAPSAGDETHLETVTGFNTAADRIQLAGHATLDTGANFAAYADPTARASEAQAYAAAYTYAYGDGGANPAHIATAYLAVQESYGGTTATYLFTPDHYGVALTGVAASQIQSGDVVAG